MGLFALTVRHGCDAIRFAGRYPVTSSVGRLAILQFGPQDADMIRCLKSKLRLSIRDGQNDNSNVRIDLYGLFGSSTKHQHAALLVTMFH